MDFKQIDVYTRSEAVDVLVMRLSELGINGFIIHDSADFEDFLGNKTANWDYVDDSLLKLKEQPTYITLYLQDNAQGLETLAELKGVLAELSDSEFYGSLEIKIDSVREEDWANNWKQYYKPFTVGERLLVKPSWENVPDTPDMKKRRVLEIDPASSFGTGQHSTTRLVMELLEKTLREGDKLLDLGCGSGILSIAAMLLGAKRAVMVDIFENVAATAAENMKKNGFSGENFLSLCGNVIEDKSLRERIGGGYNVITANIVADVIIAMSPLFGEFLAEDGTLIVSGIIDERLAEVKAALDGNGFAVVSEDGRDGWNAMALRRKETAEK